MMHRTSLLVRSQLVALIRAGFDRPHSPDGNPDAQKELCEDMRPVSADRFVARDGRRTRFVDDQVLDAISAGIPQIVVLGAGYDDRALRFTTPGVRFFEVDHPATQTDKERRLGRLGSALRGTVRARAADFQETTSPGSSRHPVSTGRAHPVGLRGPSRLSRAGCHRRDAGCRVACVGKRSRLVASLAVHRKD